MIYLDQSMKIAEVLISAGALFISICVLIAIIYYACQARKQVGKTQELVERTQKQADAANELVKLGKREFEPVATVKIIDTFVPKISPDSLLHIRRRKRMACIDVEFENISKGISQFRLATRAWFKIREIKGSSSKSSMENLDELIIPLLFREKETITLMPNEKINRVMYIGLSKIFGENSPPPMSDTAVLIDVLTNGILFVQFSPDYVNTIAPSEERFYDLYYGETTPTAIQPKGAFEDYYSFIEWTFAGRRDSSFEYDDLELQEYLFRI